MKKFLTIGVILITMLGTLGFASYRMYEHRITSPVRRGLTAALDARNSVNEVKDYIHSTRLLVRTKADQQVFNQVANSVEELETAEEDGQEAFRKLVSDECDVYFNTTIHIIDEYRSSGIRVPEEVWKHEKEQYLEAKQCREGLSNKNAQADNDKQEAFAGINKARVSLGLPVIK